MLADVVEPHDVLVGDLPRREELAAETLQDALIASEVLPQDLDGHVHAELLVPRAVNDAHSPDAGDRYDPIPSRHQGPGGQALHQLDVGLRPGDAAASRRRRRGFAVLLGRNTIGSPHGLNLREESS